MAAYYDFWKIPKTLAICTLDSKKRSIIDLLLATTGGKNLNYIVREIQRLRNELVTLIIYSPKRRKIRDKKSTYVLDDNLAIFKHFLEIQKLCGSPLYRLSFCFWRRHSIGDNKAINQVEKLRKNDRKAQLILILMS